LFADLIGRADEKILDDGDDADGGKAVSCFSSYSIRLLLGIDTEAQLFLFKFRGWLLPLHCSSLSNSGRPTPHGFGDCIHAGQSIIFEFQHRLCIVNDNYLSSQTIDNQYQSAEEFAFF
jgi:hypothetical protein